MAKLPGRISPSALFWIFVLAVFLLCGLALRVLPNCNPLPTCNPRLGLITWLGVAAFCALLVGAFSLAHDFLRALAAMWRPLVLVLASAWLLFLNDQGRELGLSLMGEKSGWRISLLFFALVYWAANNWHTARLGLRAAVARGDLPTPDGREKWLYWPPRLLGVCAHLFAAINLSLAAWSQPEFGDDRLRLLALTAPFVIICATAFVWAVDYLAISKRTARDKASLARIVLVSAGAIAFILILALVVLALVFGWKVVPSGFFWGTLSITASAVAFLSAVSVLRRKKPLGAAANEDERKADQKREARGIIAVTLGLFIVALALTLLTFLWPMQVGRLFGSMVVAYFAFGAILASVNAFELAVTAAVEQRWFGVNARPRVVGGYAVAFLLALAFLNAKLRPFHEVRHCNAAGHCVAPPAGFLTLPEERSTVQDAAKAWYEQAKAAYETSHPDQRIPMLIVATAGGGIRAAYWTATVLERLDADLQGAGGVRPYLFAISGVSGGSVGAAAFEAALAKREERQCKAGDKLPGKEPCPQATDYLGEDFLAPALASWIFVDGPSNLLPNFGQADRGAALEKSFEHASSGLLARPFLSFFPKQPAQNWRPILLLNATHEETGERIITAPVKIERDVFLDSLDALHLLGGDVRASTAAHNSARFTYVSPAGDLGNHNGFVIDGGYFENYGALSALELSRAALKALSGEAPGVKRVILLISSDPGLDQIRTLVRIRNDNGKGCLPSIAEHEPPAKGAAAASAENDQANYLSLAKAEVENAYVNELLAPVVGIQSVREAHGTRAAAELAAEICAEQAAAEQRPKVALLKEKSPQTPIANVLAKAKEAQVSDDSAPAPVLPDKSYFAHLAMCKWETRPVLPPLGWVLSDATREAFPQILDHCHNSEELGQLELALGKPPQAN